MTRLTHDTRSKGVVFELVRGALLILVLALTSCIQGAGSESSLGSSSQPLVAIAQIDSGGTAVGSFSADQLYTGGSAYSTTAGVTTTGVANAAPASVYQSERYGNFSYTIGGLTAGASYTVRLHFAEIYWTAAGNRVFNVSINGTQVLSNFDIFGAAGANTAVVRDFATTASSQGQIVVTYTSVKDSAKSSGIEVLGDSTPSTPDSNPPTAGSIQLDSGGGAVSSFASDQFYTGGAAYSTTASVVTTGVTNAAPAAVYQSERYGNFSYTIGGLTAGAGYTVRLHFAEIYWSAAGKRTFNTSINGSQVLSNFDIFSAAGAANKAVVRDFSAAANGQGQIVISYTGVIDSAKSSGLEVIPTGGTVTPPANQAPTVATSASANPSTVNGTTTSLSVLGADDGGEANLTYTWASAGSPPAAVGFSANASNAAKSTTATFSASGSYTFNVTITDAKGLTAQSTVTVSVTVPSGVPGGAGWKLVWSDEFNGSSVDTTLWNFWLDGQTRRAAVNHAANTFVSNGALTVRITNTNGQLTAGGLQSKVGFGYGYFETRGRPLGGWAGFWLQSPGIDGSNSPAVDGTEMDIMEACCPGPVQHAVHWGGYGANHQFSTHAISGVTQTDWNTYGLEWTPTSYKFWVNGKLSWTFTTAISQRSDEVIRLTQETDGDYCGGQCDYQVDYVRVYQPTQ